MAKKIQAEGTIEYARIFQENFDDNMEYHESTKGQFNMNFYPDDVSSFISAGFPEVKNGRNSLKDGNPEYGQGKFVKLKRPVYNPYLPNEDGEKGVYMGAPKVYNRTEDGSSTAEWSFTEDGALGNGTRVKVLVDVYQGRAVIDTLEKVAILEHQSYEAEAF